MSGQYQYKALCYDRSLRILTLHPARNNDAPIVIDLQEMPLDRCRRKFDALSYVWGDRGPDIDSDVLCEGKKIAVGSNCDVALRTLRYTHQKRRLFVDAICLDQENVEEKEVQVKLMGEIYILARRVLIWLGEGSTETERAFKHFRRLYEYRYLLNGRIISEKLRERIWDRIGPKDGTHISYSTVVARTTGHYAHKSVTRKRTGGPLVARH
jgi:hypothetical protein